MRVHSTRPTGRLAVLAGVAAALLAAGCGSTVSQPEKPWGPISTYKQPTITPAVRRQINHALDVFVVDGVERHAPLKALAVSSPMMRTNTTHADWANGNLPVAPYQTHGTKFHGYTVVAASPTQVNLTMVLSPRHPKTQGAVAYNARLSKVQGRWLIDWMYPTAFFAAANKTPSITAEPDLAPSAAGNTLQPKSHGQLIFEIVMAVLLLPAAAVIAYIVVHVVRDRRRPRDAEADERWRSALRPSED
ncbi:MAG: hypothetical protein ACTHNU_05090 [Gaiellales bacterium]